MDSIHRSSNRADYETPPDLIAKLKTVFAFDLDVCASRPNVCDTFYSPEQDGLSQPWHGTCWMNPPYGKHEHIDRWMQKASVAGAAGATVVSLPPARTGTRWWQSTVPLATLCVFIKGRLRFSLPGGEPMPQSAGFPSALVVWGDITYEQARLLASYGWAIRPTLDGMCPPASRQKGSR